MLLVATIGFFRVGLGMNFEKLAGVFFAGARFVDERVVVGRATGATAGFPDVFQADFDAAGAGFLEVDERGDGFFMVGVYNIKCVV